MSKFTIRGFYRAGKFFITVLSAFWDWFNSPIIYQTPSACLAPFLKERYTFFFCNVKAMNLNFSHGKTSPPNYSFKTETDSPNLLGKNMQLSVQRIFSELWEAVPNLKKSA